MKKILLLAFLLIGAPRLFARDTLNINNPLGSHPVGTPSPRADIAWLTGGHVRFDVGAPTHPGYMYLADYPLHHGCWPCDPVQIHFDAPVGKVRFYIINGSGSGNIDGQFRDGRKVDVSDDLGHTITYDFIQVVNSRPKGHWVDWPHDGVSEITIQPHVYNHYYMIDDISWDPAACATGSRSVSVNGVTSQEDCSPPKAPLALQFRLGEDPYYWYPPNDYKYPQVLGPSSVVEVPLGRTFTLLARREPLWEGWKDVPATFTLSEMQVSDGGPADELQALYPGYPLFMYNTAPSPASRVFQALRLGRATLTVDPDDSDPVTVTIEVKYIPYYGLGTPGPNNPKTWDATISHQGHLRGIPPQYIKAIAAHESSGWNTQAWRYEPGADQRYIGPNRKTDARPYKDYVLPAPASDQGGVIMGRWLCPSSVNFFGCGFEIDDLSPKTVLDYRRNNVVQALPAHDVNAFVTIREICDGNPGQNWDGCPPPPPPSPNSFAFPYGGGNPQPNRTRPFPPRDPFAYVANPHMASSYGLMQSTWYSVIENKIWEGATPTGGTSLRLNPSLLFDTNENLARGSASLIVGPNELRYQFVYRNFGQDYQRAVNPNYDNAAAFRAHMRAAIIGYNGGGTAAINYADRLVLPLVSSFEAEYPRGVNNEGGGGGTTCTAAPVVTSQSTDSLIEAGGEAPLFVTSSNAEEIYWYRGAVGNESNPIALGLAFTASPSTTTSYWAQLVNSCGVTNVPIKVTVGSGCTDAWVVSLSEEQTIVRGDTVTITAGIGGTPTGYQWYSQVSDNAPQTIAGATTRTIQVAPQDSTSYLLAVASACGAQLSPPVPITVLLCPPPPITAQPHDLSLIEGQSGELSVTATGTDLTYQWYRDGAAISGATARTLEVQPTETATYYVVVRNSCGPIKSATVTVSVCVPPSIGTPPAGAAIALGETATLTVAASGTPVLQYKWFRNGELVSGATAASYSASPSSTSTYTVQVTNSCGTVTSTPATVTVCQPPVITAQPQSISLILGQSATLSVTASHASTYQWYRNGVVISGATATSIPITDTVTTSYYVVVTNSCKPVTSATAVVSVCTPATIASHSLSSQWITKGATRELWVSGEGPNLTYRWYRGIAGDTSHVIGNSFSVFVTPTDTTSYWARVSNGCTSDDTDTIVINVCATPQITTQPLSQPIFSGQTATLSVVATQATSTPMMYQWYLGTGTSNPIPGATNSTYTTPSLTADTTYWVRITAGTCSVDSAPATISMCAYSPVLQAPDDRDIGIGQTVRLSTYLSPVPQQTRWYRGVQGNTANPISNISYVDVSPSVTTQYWAEFTHDGCTAKSRTVTVFVSIPKITQQPQNKQVNSGQTATFTVAADIPGVSYQWYSGTSGSGTAIAGQTSASFTTPLMTTTSSYWVKVTGPRGHAVDSSIATATVCAPAAIAQEPANASIRQGTTTALSVGASGTNLRYEWYRATAPSETNALGTSSSINVSPSDTTNYWVKVTSDCGTKNSATATVGVCVDPTVTGPADQVIYSGTAATLTVTASAGTNLPLSYQWYSGTSGSGTAIAGATSSTYTTPALTNSANYWVRVKSGICETNSRTVAVSICAYPPTFNAPADRDISLGQTVRLSVTISPVPASYLWFRGAQGVRTNPISSMSYVDVSPTANTEYWGEFAKDGCTTKTRTVMVWVSMPTITQQPAAFSQPNGGQTATLTVAADIPGVSYQWYSGTSGSGSPVSGATGATFITPAMPAGSSASYWVKVTGPRGHAVNGNTAAVNWCVPATISQHPQSYSIRRGSSATIAVTAAGTNLRYQWYRATSPTETNAVNGATASVYSVSLPQGSVSYWVKVTSDCGVANSVTSRIDVCDDPTINTQPASQTINSGSSATLTVAATSTTSMPLSYQWYSGTTGTGTAISGATSATFTTPALTAAANYWVKVTSGVCSTNSATAAVSLCPYPATVNTPADKYSRSGVANLLSISLNPQPETYKWYRGAQGDRSTLLSTGPSFNVYPTVTTQYWGEFTYQGCVTKSRTVTVYVCIPTIQVQPQPQTINRGSRATLSVTATEASTYQWYRTTSPSLIPGATSATFQSDPLNASETFWVEVTGSCEIQKRSDYVDVTVNP